MRLTRSNNPRNRFRGLPSQRSLSCPRSGVCSGLPAAHVNKWHIWLEPRGSIWPREWPESALTGRYAGRSHSRARHRIRSNGVARALGEPRAPSLLGGGKGKGRGTEGVGPSHREHRNREQGKGFGAKTITYRPAGETAEEGERDQDAGSKPGRGRDADRRRMGSERHSPRRRSERGSNPRSRKRETRFRDYAA